MIKSPIVKSLLGVFLLVGALPAAASYAAAPDLSSPEKACVSMLAALRADDATGYRACFAATDPRYAALLDATLTRNLSEHRLLQVASTRFGHAEVSRLVDWALGDNDDIDRMMASDSLKPLEFPATVTTREIRMSSRIFDLHLQNSAWKIALGYLGNYDDPAPQLRKATAESRHMDDISTQLRAGAFANVEEARSALGLLAIAKATDSAPPAERWAKRAAEPGLTPLQKAVYLQIGVLSQCELQQMMVPGSYELDQPAKGTPDAAGRLSRMGLDILPLLAEALDDTTLTRTRENSMRIPGDPIPVKQLAARLIVTISGRTFTVPNGNSPADLRNSFPAELAPQFQKEIATWYAEYQKRTWIERQIADVEDSYFSNRLNALDWLHSHPVPAAAPAMVRNIDRLLKEMEKSEDSLRATELSATIAALATCGTAADEPAMRRGCMHLLQTYSASWSSQERNLSNALFGWAALGGRAEAAHQLEAMLDNRAIGFQSPQIAELRETLRALKIEPGK